jgi:citrate lyase beta subunit
MWYRAAHFCIYLGTTSARLALLSVLLCCVADGVFLAQAIKAVSLGVDCICLDCEDAVAAERKEDARKGIVQILQTVCVNS